MNTAQHMLLRETYPDRRYANRLISATLMGALTVRNSDGYELQLVCDLSVVSFGGRSISRLVTVPLTARRVGAPMCWRLGSVDQVSRVRGRRAIAR